MAIRNEGNALQRLFGRSGGADAPAQDPWTRIFSEAFGVAPSEAQLQQLRQLADSGGMDKGAHPYRRVLAAFDQQVVGTGFTVRWGERDVRRFTTHGFVLMLDEADFSVSQVIASGHYEPHLIAFFEAFVKPGMHVVDAGANIGFYSLLSSRLSGPGGKVVSFEPNSENARLLLVSAIENNMQNIELHPLALGNARGHVQFTSALGTNGGIVGDAQRNLRDASCRIVPIARLDDFGIERLDLLKMDVEGAEAVLLEGGMETVKRCRPVIVSEFSYEMLNRISGWHGARFIKAIEALGYATFMSDRQTHALAPTPDADAFVEPFVGTGRIEDLVFCPVESVAALPLRGT